MMQAKVNFKAILLLSLILASFGGWLSAQEASTSLLLTTSADQVATGEILSVNIQIEDVENVYGGRIKLAYDPSRFEIMLDNTNAVTPGAFFSEQPGMTLRNTVDPAAGIVDYAITLRRPAEPVSGSGLIATVNFRALASGSATFDLVEAVLSSPRFEEIEGQRVATSVENIPVNVQALSLDVTGETVAPVAAPVIEEAAPPVVEAETNVAPLPAEAPQSLFDEPAPVLPAYGPSPAIVVGITFFILGLLMFMFSLLSFIRLRQNFRLVY